MSYTSTIREPALTLKSPAAACFERGSCDGIGWPLLAGGMLWLLFVLTGSFLMASYSQTPGAEGAQPAHWPSQSAIVPAAGQPTLLMFVHPRCPCSRASIGELATLMAQAQGKVSAQVWFFKPANEAEGWAKTDLWDSAAAIPGVTTHVDKDGTEARRFQAETSGQATLYGKDGSLVFQGGITLSRGHAGDNPGRDAVIALLGHAAPSPVRAPVFGCALADKQCLVAEGTCKQP